MTDSILQFEAVTLPAADAYDQEVAGLDFALRAGDCLLVAVEDERPCPPLADAAEGLLEPSAGRVLMHGADWQEMSPDESSLRRSRIGRVFESQAWLSNLDVDENVTLAQRHHARRSEAEIREEAVRWVQRFGRDALPAMRPAWAPRHELIIAQWVRALLGEPELLIMERATRDATHEECAQLVEAAEEHRRRGAALIWLSSDERFLNNQSLAPTVRAKMKGERWEIVG